jgi:hypothetical protein
MRKWIRSGFLVVPLALAAALVYANRHGSTPYSANAAGFVCPVTGEVLPCERCCPLRQGKGGQGAADAAKSTQGCCTRQSRGEYPARQDRT